MPSTMFLLAFEFSDHRGQKPAVAKLLDALVVSHPEGAVGALRHGVQGEFGQALGRAENRNRIALKPHEFFARTGPDGAIPLLEQESDRSVQLPGALGAAPGFAAELLQDAAFATGPDVVRAVAQNRPGEIAREPVPGAIDGDFSRRPDAGHSGGSPQPDISPPVLLNRADTVAGKPFPHGAHGYAVFLKTVDAPSGRAQPHTPFGIFQQAPDHLVGKAIAGLIGTELPAGEAAETAAFGADPERAVPVGEERQDAAWGNAVAGREGAELAVAQLGHAAPVRTHPDSAIGGRCDSKYQVLGQSVLSGIDALGSAIEPVQTVVRRHPDGAGGVFHDGMHIGFHGACEEAGDAAVVETRESAVAADPQRSA